MPIPRRPILCAPAAVVPLPRHGYSAQAPGPRPTPSAAGAGTAGVPGRAELNDSQEINYPAIMKAIVETGYTGYVGQEFIPTIPDKIASLREGVMVCDV